MAFAPRIVQHSRLFNRGPMTVLQPASITPEPTKGVGPGIGDTAAEASACLDQLLSIMRGFPFLDDASRSVALALMMTPLVRQAGRAAPVTAISGPKMGSGKTLLANIPAYIATGRRSALISQAPNPEDERHDHRILQYRLTFHQVCEIALVVAGQQTRKIHNSAATAWVGHACSGNGPPFSRPDCHHQMLMIGAPIQESQCRPSVS